MDELEVQDYEMMRLDDDLRQPWPVEGMACNVPSCNTHIYTSYRAYIKHWKKIHTQYISISECEICNINRKCLLNRHFRFVHKLNGAQLANKFAQVTVRNIINDNYVSPGDVLPPKKKLIN
ncbi:Hypothetical predicted protein [Mytilus galloprovincialis]|uniref:Uncharacterized protein n=1 Tax=Mytilus galloprovincialis TaxID=29158 RepID=A0A8B6HIY4_MYTGA|nr:Hypothetical predicted protein [Mytilus galloprovincialis]